MGKSTVHDINQDNLKSFQIEVQEGDFTKKRGIVRKADYNELDRMFFYGSSSRDAKVSFCVFLLFLLLLFHLIFF